MEQKITEACRTNAKGLSAYLRTKDIESLIDGLKSELNDIKLDWMVSRSYRLSASINECSHY